MVGILIRVRGAGPVNAVKGLSPRPEIDELRQHPIKCDLHSGAYRSLTIMMGILASAIGIWTSLVDLHERAVWAASYNRLFAMNIFHGRSLPWGRGVLESKAFLPPGSIDPLSRTVVRFVAGLILYDVGEPVSVFNDGFITLLIYYVLIRLIQGGSAGVMLQFR